MTGRPGTSQGILAALVAVGMLIGPAAAQQVLVVDDDGGAGVDHTSLQAAVDAAADGDVVLVRPGSYGALDLPDTELVVTADILSAVDVGPVTVSRLAADRRQVLANLELLGDPGGHLPALSALGLAGALMVDFCELRGPLNPLPGDAQPALLVTDGTRLALSRSIVDLPTFARAEALVARRAEVHVFRGLLEAGDEPVAGGQGPAGVRVEGGLLTLSDASLQGGVGGSGVDVSSDCVPGGDGGPALRAMAADGVDPVVLSRAPQLLGGSGGLAPPSGGCLAGLQGAPAEIQAGSWLDASVDVPRLHVDSPVREGQSVRWTVYGEPGDLAWLLWSADWSPAWLPGWHGTLLPSGPGLAPLGVVPAGGELTVNTRAGQLPGGEAAVLLTQVAAARDAEVVLGNPAALVLLAEGL